MNITEMHSWFNILMDSYNEPYFIDTEIDEMLNRGHTDFVNDIIFKEFMESMGQNEKGMQVLNSFESNIQGSEVLQALMMTDLPVSAVSGKITYSDINSQIVSELASAGRTEPNSSIMHLISIMKDHDTEGLRIVRFVRHNDIPRFNQNVFKKATDRNPIFKFYYNGISIEPSDNGDYIISCIKFPRKVDIIEGIDSELPEFTHPLIIAYALSSAGLASRDDVLLRLQQLSGNKTDRQ